MSPSIIARVLTIGLVTSGALHCAEPTEESEAIPGELADVQLDNVSAQAISGASIIGASIIGASIIGASVTGASVRGAS